MNKKNCTRTGWTLIGFGIFFALVTMFDSPMVYSPDIGFEYREGKAFSLQKLQWLSSLTIITGAIFLPKEKG